MSAPYGQLSKHPDALKRIKVRWADWLTANGVTIAQSIWQNATTGGGSVTLSESALVDANNTSTSVLLTGGSDGVTEWLENEVTFSDGSKEVFTVRVDVDDRIVGN